MVISGFPLIDQRANDEKSSAPLEFFLWPPVETGSFGLAISVRVEVACPALCRNQQALVWNTHFFLLSPSGGPGSLRTAAESFFCEQLHDCAPR